MVSCRLQNISFRVIFNFCYNLPPLGGLLLLGSLPLSGDFVIFTAVLSEIAIFFAFEYQEDNGGNSCHQFCRHDGEPYTVDTPQEREDDHRRYLEHQRSEEGDQSGGKTVVQCGEEG